MTSLFEINPFYECRNKLLFIVDYDYYEFFKKDKSDFIEEFIDLLFYVIDNGYKLFYLEDITNWREIT